MMTNTYIHALLSPIQDKARAEIDEIFGDSSRSAEYQDLLDMVYLEMVIKESLRLYPSVPLIMRRITEDVPFRKIFNYS